MGKDLGANAYSLLLNSRARGLSGCFLNCPGRLLGMPRTAPPIHLDVATRSKLELLAKAPSTPQALAVRARIVLAAHRACSNLEIAAQLGITASTVGKWRSQFAQFGMPGLRDGRRAGRPGKHGSRVWKQLWQLLRQPPPDSRKRWTVRSLAQQVGLPRSTVHEILLRHAGRLRRRQPGRAG